MAASLRAAMTAPIYIDHPQFEGFEVRQTSSNGFAWWLCQRTRDLVADETGLHGWTGRRVGRGANLLAADQLPITEGAVTHNGESKTRAKNAWVRCT
jgi:hypothetical protein